MTDEVVISSVILNWNRSDLLRITVESYLRTIRVPYELIIVDNGSTDDSRKVLEELKNKYNDKIHKIILLDKNMGGEAINLGLSEAKGKLIHISENDIEYLPGWSEKVVRLFNVFNELGQLSLFSPVPTDEEVWVPHPIKRILYREGEIIYEALGNVGTTSVIRRDLWDKGVRVHTIKTDKFLFPDDVRLSEDISRFGYIVAWAPYYLVRNLGHSYNEIKRRIEYYKKNYESKKGLGYEGLLKRIDYYERKIKPDRKSILWIDSIIQPEISNFFRPIFTDEGKILDSQTWSCVNGITPEIENLELIYSLLRAFKPSKCLLLSWIKDLMADITKQALENNGFGSLIILSDIADNKFNESSMVQIRNYEDIINIKTTIDCIIYNSYFADKLEIFKRSLSKLAPRSLVVVTGNYEGIRRLVNIWYFLSENFNCSFISSPRGLLICTSKIESQIEYYILKRTPKDLVRYINKNKFLNKVVKIYLKLRGNLKR